MDPSSIHTTGGARIRRPPHRYAVGLAVVLAAADVTVRVNPIGAHEVQLSAGTISPDEGHIHVSVDAVLFTVN